MGFLPYNHLILYDTHFLNVMHVTEHSGGSTPSDTPAHMSCCYTAHPHFPFHSSSSLWHGRWHQSVLLAWWPSYHPVRPHWLAPTPCWECGLCVCESRLFWRGSNPPGMGPPPPHHVWFTHSVIFFNYLQHLSISKIFPGGKMHKTSQTRQHVWVNDFQLRARVSSKQLCVHMQIDSQ